MGPLTSAAEGFGCVRGVGDVGAGAADGSGGVIGFFGFAFGGVTGAPVGLGGNAFICLSIIALLTYSCLFGSLY